MQEFLNSPWLHAGVSFQKVSILKKKWSAQIFQNGDNTSTWLGCAYEDKTGKRTLQFQGNDKNSIQVYRDHITVSRRWQNYANVSLWRPLYYVKTMVKQCYIKWLRPHCNVKLWCQNLVISWSNDKILHMFHTVLLLDLYFS